MNKFLALILFVVSASGCMNPVAVPTAPPITPTVHGVTIHWRQGFSPSAAPRLGGGLQIMSAGFPQAEDDFYTVYRVGCDANLQADTATGISVCPVEDGPMKKIGSTITTSYLDTNVVSGALYSYCVSATFDGVETDCSEHAGAQVPQ